MRATRASVFAGLIGVLAATGVAANDDPMRKAQELRQAPMKLIGNNFGFMGAMVKEKMPWDDKQFLERGRELGAIGQLDLLRGYVEGSYEGRTRAKPDVELDFEDFRDKMKKFESSLQEFGSAADAAAMKAAFSDLAENCKGCHKKYKNKNYASD